MRIKLKFTLAELEQIGKSKHRLMRIELLERHLKNLYRCLQDNIAELTELGYRKNKLSKAPGTGCKPRGCTAKEMLLEKAIDEQNEVKCKMKKAEIELKKIVKILHKMPTDSYKDILIKKYVTRTKMTQRDRDLRRYHLDDAYLEFYRTWQVDTPNTERQGGTALEIKF